MKPHLKPMVLVHFRQRIRIDLVNQVNREMVSESNDSEEEQREEEEQNQRKNQGKLILDATCAPADISYPTDLGILNQAREQSEKIVDSLYEPIKEKFFNKPRT